MESIGFTTNDVRKHLGYRVSAANIGETWEFCPSVYGYYYFEEGGDKYASPISDIKDVFPVTMVDFYYWDAEQNEYKPLLAPPKTTLDERTASLFTKDLITNDNSVRIAHARQIREWLLLNAHCSASVYIDKDFVIYSEEPITIKADLGEQVPDFIRIKKYNKQDLL